ncbi:transposase family protein, partial [Streptomyces mirabilis]
KHHGGNVQVIATPDGWPIWVSPVRPGREHDTTCARHHGLIDALNRIAAELDMPTLVDLGYENAGDGFRHPHKKPAGGELTEAQQTYNKVIRGIHGVCERANSLLKTTFKALRRVSLDPSRITKIAAAALVLLQLEYDRTI